MKDDTKTIIHDALSDYNAIMEAANANAKNKLAEAHSVQFNKILKEELENKNKSAKESYKRIDENKESEQNDEPNLNNESVMENKTNEASKVVKGVKGNSEPFNNKPKEVKKVDESIGTNAPFNTKTKQPLQEFNLTELDASGVGAAIDGANQMDEVITMDEIQQELQEMEGLSNELDNAPIQAETSNQPYDKLIEMRNQLDEMISSMGGNAPATTEVPAEDYEQQSREQGDRLQNPENQYDDTENFDSNEFDQAIQEYFEGENQEQGNQNFEITDDEIKNAIGETELEEAKGISYSDGTITPGKLGDHEGTHGRFRQVESEKKLAGLINENKTLIKRINEDKKFKKSVTTLVEQYKGALEKYRGQLKEMAIFNTNLANVNNLLVNEELALTQDDKIKIINEFKNVNTITESQKMYKTIISEMKNTKKTISESIENKVSVSVQPSSKGKLDEVIEKTAYKDDNINKILKNINYMENRGKK